MDAIGMATVVDTALGPVEHVELGAGSPVLFVHGGYCDAWCWDAKFLPWFARHGYSAHALSLRGHGTSDGRDLLWHTGLDDYAADVERVCASLPSPPAFGCHSATARTRPTPASPMAAGAPRPLP